MRFLSALIQVSLLALAVSAQSNGTNTTAPAPPPGTAPTGPAPYVGPWATGVASAVLAPVATRIAFGNSWQGATTPAISINGYVVYGAAKQLVFAPTTCLLSGGPQVNNPSCASSYVATPFSVTSVAKVNSTTFVAIFNQTAALYVGMTQFATWNVTGGTLDFVSFSYQPSYPTPLFGDNGTTMYIGTQNYTNGQPGYIYKISLSSFKPVWMTATPNEYANYPLAWGWIGGEEAIGFRSSRAYGNNLLSPYSNYGYLNAATGAIVQSKTTYVDNDELGLVAIAYGYVVFYSGGGAFRMLASNGRQAPDTMANDACSSAINLVIVNSTWAVTTCGSYAYLYDLTKYWTSTSSVTSVWVSGSTIYQIVPVNGSAGAMVTTSGGIYAITWDFTGDSSSYQKFFDLPTNSGGAESLWWMGSTLIATWNQGIYGAGNGGGFAFNGTTGQQLWRMTDNYDAVGPAIYVPGVSPAVGMSFFGAARNNNGKYGVRSVLGWASNGTGQLSAAISNSYGSQYTMYCPMTNLIYTVNYNGRFWAYNPTNLQTTNFSVVFGSADPTVGIVTFPTRACVGYGNVYCVNLATGAPMTISISGYVYRMINSNGKLFVVNGYGDSYLIDVSVASPTATKLTQSSSASGISFIGFESPAGTIVAPYTGGTDVIVGGKAVAATAGPVTTAGVTIFTSNAIMVDGNAYVAGTVSSTGFSTVSGNVIARIEIPTPAMTRYTQKGLSTITYLTSLGKTIIGIGSGNVSAWGPDGTNYYVIGAPAGTQFYAPTGYGGFNYGFVPTVDSVNGLLMVGLVNASSTSQVIGHAIYNVYTGALYEIVAVTGSDSAWSPRTPSQLYNGYLLVSTVTHACTWNFTASASIAATSIGRMCMTIDGTSTNGGYGVMGGWLFFGQIGQTAAVPLANVTSLQATAAQLAQFAGSFAPPSLLAELKANAVVIGVAIAAVLVVIIVIVVVVKVCSGGAKKPADNYVAMNQASGV